MLRASRRRVAALAVAILLLALLPSREARAAELSVLVGSGSPSELWGTAWGGMLTITLFNIVSGEIEGARQSGALEGTTLYTASAKAYLAPQFGRLVPYGGIGAGLYHQSLPGDDDQGTTGLVFVGVKLKFPVGLVLRGEYQWVSLPDAAPILLDNRYFIAAGFSF